MSKRHESQHIKTITRLVVLTSLVLLLFAVWKLAVNAEKRRNYAEGIKLLLNEEYKNAIAYLSDSDYEDSFALTQYADMQSNIGIGGHRIDELEIVKNELQDLCVTNSDIAHQKGRTIDSIDKALELQSRIASIDLSDLSVESRESIDSAINDLTLLENRFKEYIDSEKLYSADMILRNVEDDTEVGIVYTAINDIDLKQLSYYSAKEIDAIYSIYRNLSKDDKYLIANLEYLEEAKKKVDDIIEDRKNHGIKAPNGEYVQRYYEDEIDDTVEKVMSINNDNTLVFFLCTDIHYMSTSGDRVKLDTVTDMVRNMNVIAEYVTVDGVICLGDIVDGTVEKSKTIEYIDYVMEQLESVGGRIMYAQGNHDDNRYYKKATECFDLDQMKYLYFDRVSDKRNDDVGYYGSNYYVDFEKNNIRVFSLNSNYYAEDGKWKYGYADETVEWFERTLLGTPSNMSVIVINHRGLIKENNWKRTVSRNNDEMERIVRDFIDSGGSYIATLYGHSHIDYYNTKPWLEICTGAAKSANFELDSNYPDGILWNRVAGTCTEDLWDVVLIDTDAKSISLIRFGAGEDRFFRY